MEKFFKLLYYYVLGGVFLLVVYLSVALFFSPKVDAEKRGFIPCTEKFVTAVSNCERGTLGCTFTALWEDTKCNLYVIFDNLGAWVRGTQPTPWSNYFFEPTVQAQLDEENSYDGNVVEDMNNLEKRRIFIERRQQELQDAKEREMQLLNDVLVPENENSENDEKYIRSAEPETENSEDDSSIEDEAFMEDFGNDVVDDDKANELETNKKGDKND